MRIIHISSCWSTGINYCVYDQYNTAFIVDKFDVATITIFRFKIWIKLGQPPHIILVSFDEVF